MINHARKKSGVVPPAKPEHVADALTKLREETYMTSAINVIFHGEQPGALATKIAEKWRFDKTASGRFVADLIRGPYKSWVQPILRPLEESIDRAADVLWDSPRNEQSLRLIEQKLSKWDEYVQPIQLIDEAKGFDEQRSSEICGKLRDLALHLNNNEGEPEISLRITKLLNKVFPELPEAAKGLAEDLETLEKIVGEKHRNTEFKERLQAFMNAVESTQNNSGKIVDLINALSALLNEYTGLANDEKIWNIARSVALALHNKHDATLAALRLTTELLSLMDRFTAPKSIYNQLYKDRKFLEETVSRSVTSAKKPSWPRYSWVILPVVAIIIYSFTHVSSKNDTLVSTSRQTDASSIEKPTVKPRRVYVTALKLNVRNLPNGDIVGSFDRYQNVVAVGPPKNGWQKIVGGQENSYSGYVWAQYIKTGDGTRAKCGGSIARPKSGALLKISRPTGTSSISVHNGGDSDVIIKLRDQSNKIVVAFYLRQNEAYTYNRVPNKLLLFTYANGKNYSTECGVFMDDMRAHRSPDRDDYSSGTWTYKLKPVKDGNLRPQNMKIEDF